MPEKWPYRHRRPYREVIREVKETTLNAYAHQDVPFEQLVDHLQITRKINCNPVFQVVFVLQNTANTQFELTEIEAEALQAGVFAVLARNVNPKKSNSLL